MNDNVKKSLKELKRINKSLELKQAIREVLLEREVIDALAAAICNSPENFWNQPATEDDYGPGRL